MLEISRVGSDPVGSVGFQIVAGRSGWVMGVGNRDHGSAGISSGQESFKSSRVESGWARGCRKSRSRVGWDPVGSREFQVLAGRVGLGQGVSEIERVGWDPVGSKGFQILASRVGLGHGGVGNRDHGSDGIPSGQEGFKSSRVGSGWVMGVSKIEITGRVGSRRVRRFSNLTDRDEITVIRSDPQQVI